MVTRAYFARRFLTLKLLRGALVAGALYDAGLAFLLLRRSEPVAAPLGWSGGPQPTAAAMIAIWLAVLAALGIAAARDPRRYSAVIAMLICGRGASAAVLAIAALAAGAPLPWPAGWSALLAFTLAAAWWQLRR